MNNINTKEYWENRFLKSWVGNGEKQTLEYAKANVKCLPLSRDFKGTILDFGCALGDAIPIYAEHFPNAKLLGIDISENAIKSCKQKFGHIADFLAGDLDVTPFANVIIASHVLEHITNDKKLVNALLSKCNDLFVFVPYKESPLFIEHVNYYDNDYYDDIGVFEKKELIVKYTKPIPFTSFLKNILKLRLALKESFKKEIIMFHFKRAK